MNIVLSVPIMSTTYCDTILRVGCISTTSIIRYTDHVVNTACKLYHNSKRQTAVVWSVT